MRAELRRATSRSGRATYYPRRSPTGKSRRSRRPARHSQPGQVMASLPVLRPDVHAYHVHVHPHTNIHVEEMRARETKL